MKKIDLHMHSYCSDGTLNCKALLEEIKTKDIRLFSLTDHDTIDGLEEMIEAVEGHEVEFVPGVELATTYLGKEFHLTTYGYDAGNAKLLKLLKENQQIRKDFDLEIMKFLENHPSIEVSFSEFLKYEDDPYLGGWPSLNYLKKMKIINDIGDYFRITAEFALKMTFPQPEEIIKIAHDAGAYVFLAHPSSNQRGGLDESVLDDFKRFGIDGIECYSPYCQSQEEAERYVDYCNQNQLRISGGSDYHGAFVGRHLGVPEVTSEMISYDFFKSLCDKV